MTQATRQPQAWQPLITRLPRRGHTAAARLLGRMTWRPGCYARSAGEGGRRLARTASRLTGNHHGGDVDSRHRARARH